MQRSRLSRVEREVRALPGPRCPLCRGTGGAGGVVRVLVQEAPGPPRVLDGPDCYGEDGRCRRCGGRPDDVIVLVPYATGGAGAAM